MNLNFLRTFICVVEEGNYSRAANRLHLSQPAVSMQMQTLAEDLGVELFRRRGHRVELTEGGAILYDRARDVLGLWQKTVHQLEGLRQRLQGRLELGASTVPGDYLLPLRLCEFYRLHPDLEVRMQVAPSREIVRELAAGRLDLAVVGYKPQEPGLESEVLFQDELVAIVSPDHDLARRKFISVEALLANPFLQRTAGSATRQVLDNALEAKGISPRQLPVAMELGSSRALLEAAAQGLGLAVVSSLAAADCIRQGRLVSRPVSGLDLRRNFWLVLTKAPRSPALAAFIEFLRRSDYLV
ncbi:MAG: selenium metabolism-associated LysR family transcriptional regulator [Eubacteriales bacterium]|nr:selenium metabolism-associated LysR family transcriptional regulator [Eubacteriales bacterium]